jgi:hypothetical protein
MYTNKVFPRIPNLPQDVIEGAALLAMGDARGLKKAGWKFFGSGAFSNAYTNHEYVIKSCNNVIDSVEGFAEQWYTENRNIIGAVAAARSMLVPTEWLFDCVAVQEVVPVLACDIWGDDIEDEIYQLADNFQDDMEAYMGMCDIHSYNWGIGHDGKIRIFDPMFEGQAWYPEQGRVVAKAFVKKIA